MGTTTADTAEFQDGGKPISQPRHLVDPTTGKPIGSSANPLNVTGGGGGVQYVDGNAAPTHPTGTELVYNNAGVWVAVSNTNGLPIAGSITASNPSVGVSGSAIPTSSTLIGASDGTNLQQLTVESSSNKNLRTSLYNGANEASVSAGGALKVDNSAVTQPVSGTVTTSPPANASTNVTQFGGVAVLLDNTNELKTSLYGKNTTAGDTPVLVDASGRPIVNVNSLPALPAGANTIGNVGLVAGSALVGAVEITDSGGINKLSVDASGRLTLVPNQSVNHAQVSGTTTSVNAGTADAGTQRIINAGASAGAKTNVSGSASSTTILASNTSRKGAMVYNDSTAILYLDLSGGTASSSSYSVQILANSFFELPGPTIYNGAITGIWSSATGNARVTEFS